MILREGCFFGGQREWGLGLSIFGWVESESVPPLNTKP